MRCFKDDVTVVLATSNVKGDRLTFPLSFTKEFKEESIEIMQLSARAGNSLKRGGVFTIGNMLEKFDNLGKLRNCGENSVKEIKNAFLQAWYEQLEPEQVTEFWEEFVKENCI